MTDRDGMPSTAGVERVVALLDEVAAANGQIAAEAARIAGSGELVSTALVGRLTSLGERLRPGAAAARELAGVDPVVLLAGTRLWVDRKMAARPAGAGAAAARAAARWGGDRA